MLPKSVYGTVTSCNQLQYKVWLMCLRSSQDRLKDNLHEIDRLKTNLLAVFQEINRNFDRFKDEIIAKLEEMQRKLQENVELAVQETHLNAINYYYQPSSELAAAIWKQSQENSSVPITIFTHSVDICEEIVKKCMKIEVKTQFSELKWMEIMMGSEEMKHKGVQIDIKNREITEIRTFDALIPLQNQRISCEKCGKKRSKGSFSMVLRGKGHNCRVCDACISLNFEENWGIMRCFVCGDEYPPEFRQILLEKHRKSKGKVCKRCLFPMKIDDSSSDFCKNCQITSKKCTCGSEIVQKDVNCRNFCVCSQCLLTSFLSTRSTTCPICISEVTYTLPEALQCSYCCRGLKLRTESLYEGVSCVCRCGGVLCCYCVQVRGETCGCPLSEEGVRLIADLGEIGKAQREAVAGCYCGGRGTALAKLKCGHMVHNDCRGRIFRCRVCKCAVRDLPKVKLLKDYLTSTESET